MKKTLLLGVAALSLFAAGCGAGSGAGDEDTIQLGAMFEKTGPVSAYGTAESNGVKLAIKEINEAGGILDKQIELTEYDTKSDNVEATSIATRLATEDNVVAIVGPATSGAVQAATQPITRAEVPLVTPSGTADNLTLTESGDVQPFVFRTSFQDSFQGVALANFAMESLGAKKAVIIGDSSSDYAVGLTNAFKDTYEGEIVAEEYFTQDDTDFSAILTKIQNQDFDFIYLPAYYEQAGLILKQAREMGLDQPVLGGDGFSNQALLDLAGTENVSDVYYSAHFSLENEDEQVQTFIDNYTAEYDTAPDAFSALAYDAVYLVAQAIEDGGEATPEAITDALESITDFDGVTGTFSIDENHNPVKSTLIIELQDGKETSTQEIQP